MFSKKCLAIIFLLALLGVGYFLLQPKPITIEAAPAQSAYSQCCLNTNGEPACVNEAGESIAFAKQVPLAQLSACPDGQTPSNKPDFSRHQILRPNDVLGQADCCALNTHSQRCTLANGHSFEMPMDKSSAQPIACSE